MAKQTLLQMTQNILSALDSDPVDSIDETVEAIQVAELVKEAYFDLISQRDWPFLFVLGTLDGVGDVNNPSTLKPLNLPSFTSFHTPSLSTLKEPNHEPSGASSKPFIGCMPLLLSVIKLSNIVTPST